MAGQSTGERDVETPLKQCIVGLALADWFMSNFPLILGHQTHSDALVMWGPEPTLSNISEQHSEPKSVKNSDMTPGTDGSLSLCLCLCVCGSLSLVVLHYIGSVLPCFHQLFVE